LGQSSGIVIWQGFPVWLLAACGADTLAKLADRHRQLVAAFLKELPAAANEVSR
jgi:hypothetical protein